MDHISRISRVARLGTAGDEAALEEQGLDDQIVSSWHRCLSTYGIDPVSSQSVVVLDSPELKEHQERLDHMLKIADAEMQLVYEAAAGSGYAIILTDAQGVILHHVSDPRLEREFRDAGLWVGASWDEEAQGTNGIGTCIIEGKPITVHRDEHFRSQNIDLTCSAAPIRDPRGELIAVLDSSACTNEDSRNSQTHVRALVSTSARLIENRNFLFEFRNKKVLRFHSRPEYVGLPNEAMLALDGDCQILAANGVAVDFLNAHSRRDLIGRSLSEVLDAKSTRLIDEMRSKMGTLLPIRGRATGRRFFAMLHAPTAPTPVARVETPAPTRRDKSRLDLRAVAGRDPHMNYNVRCAERIMNKNVPIIIEGETGTGKEVFALAIHLASDRRDQPFVALNCSAIPESLIESELFGYKHGAFTGARREGMKGKILQSSGGTLFLDEIGDMPLPLQTRLLRCLEEGEVVPLGGDKSISVDLNVISATHRDLESLVERETFREDLYYRLNGISLTLAPLREREDREQLIESIVALENESEQAVRIDDEAMDKLVRFDWPGNIRQLRNVIRTALAMADNHVLRLADLPGAVVNARERASPAGAARSRFVTQSAGASVPETVGPRAAGTAAEAELNPLEVAEKEAILMALAANCWNITNTAAALDMSRNTLYRKLKRHGLPTTRPA
jgi:transcriptional regulator of acetoin/glycerol metabolism